MIIPPVFIITGRQGGGKTSRLHEVIGSLKQANYSLAGFTAPGIWEGGIRTGFDIRDSSDGKTKLLCRDQPAEGRVKAGRFYFNPEAIAFGAGILNSAAPNDVMVIDEVGRFELQGLIWHDVLVTKLSSRIHPMLLVVRDQFLHQVVSRYGIRNPFSYPVEKAADAITKGIREQLDLFHNSAGKENPGEEHHDSFKMM